MNEGSGSLPTAISPQGKPSFPSEATNVAAFLAENPIRYSICSLVTKPAEYSAMVENFRAGGFIETAGCEFLYLDNASSNGFEAYSGYNMFLRAARGKYIILCHQDVLLLEDKIEQLDKLIHELDTLHPSWGLFGNAGGVWPNRLAMRISDKFGEDQSRGGPFPVASLSLDENFIVVKAEANLALSKDLSGFHFYGTELCLVAAHLGYQAYVVDFHLYHAGEAKVDQSFLDIRNKLIRKYSRTAAVRMITTTCDEFVITPWRPFAILINSRKIQRFTRFVNRFVRPL